MQIGETLYTVNKLARRAGDEVMKFYGRPQAVREKTNHTPVTAADMASEHLIRTFLGEQFNYPILSEETADNPERLTAEYVWIVDPLDGTRDFIRGTGDFSILIGLIRNGKPVLGAIYLPTARALYCAELGRGAFRSTNNGELEPIHVSEERELHNMTAIVGRAREQELTYQLAYDLGAKEVKRTNSVGVKAVRLAEGQADIYLNATRHASEWDTCAADIIISEAGGRLTDLYGHTLRYNLPDVTHHHGLLGSNGQRHDGLVERVLPLLPNHNISLPD